MSDRSVARQLTFGFYSGDAGNWRWVTRNFGVALRPPDHAGRTGADLVTHVFFPLNEMEMLGSVTLTASADNTVIGSQTFSAPGAYDFRAHVAPELLDTNILPVLFCFDKAMPRGTADDRELAGVITEISLVSAGH